MTPQTGDLRVYVSFVEPPARAPKDQAFWQIYGWAAEVAPGNSFAYCDGHGTHSSYENLSAHAQAHAEYLRKQPALNGWGLRCGGFMDCDLDRAKRMHATLSRLHNRIARYAERNGPCQSYGHYVLRFGRAIGARSMVFAAKERSNGEMYRFCSLFEGMTTIDSVIVSWHQQLLSS